MKRDCECCAGSGVAWRDVADSRGEHDTEEEPCEACDGAGEVDDEFGSEEEAA